MAMVWKLQAIVFSFSEETTYDVDTTSIILSYVIIPGMKNNYLRTANLQHTKPCK